MELMRRDRRMEKGGRMLMEEALCASFSDGRDMHVFKAVNGVCVAVMSRYGTVVYAGAYKNEKPAVDLIYRMASEKNLVLRSDEDVVARYGCERDVCVVSCKVFDSRRVVYVAAHALDGGVDVHVFDGRLEALLCAACAALGCTRADAIVVGDDVFCLREEGGACSLRCAVGALRKSGDRSRRIETVCDGVPVADALSDMWATANGGRA